MKNIKEILKKIYKSLINGWSEAGEIQNRIDQEKEKYHRKYWRG